MVEQIDLKLILPRLGGMQPEAAIRRMPMLLQMWEWTRR